MKVIALALVGVGAALALAGCGGDDGGACGNGVAEAPEECDDGNDDETDYCRGCLVFLPPRTVVKWRFNSEAAPGFTQDACVDLGVRTVRVELEGPSDQGSMSSMMLEGNCSDYQVVFEGLEPGAYMARVTPLDGAGASLVSGPAQQEVTATDAQTEYTINVPWDLWVGPYTGWFFFRVYWTGAGCSEMAVAQQVLTLRVGGALVAQTTVEGTRLDGSAPGPCMEPTAVQRAVDVPSGPARIEISGRNAGGVELYRGAFDTFVGAGAINPEIVYDVPSIFDAAPPDAVPIDAMPPDAGVPDASL